jgi:26S proteasome regulatory subunit N6
MSGHEALAAELAACQELASSKPPEAAQRLKAMVQAEGSNDVESVKVKESAIQALCDLLVKQQDANALSMLLGELRGFFGCIPKAKTAKIVRGVVDSIAKIPGSTQLQVFTCSLSFWIIVGNVFGAHIESSPLWCNVCRTQLDVCKQQVEWARTEKRTFLRQRIELRLASLYTDTKDFAASLALIGT